MYGIYIDQTNDIDKTTTTKRIKGILASDKD